LLGRLDALGDGRDPEAAAEARDGAHDRPAIVPEREVANEALVDLLLWCHIYPKDGD
jgi:hypothetical protein